MQNAAEVDKEPEEISTEKQYLTFLMDREEYAIDITKVVEIRGWDKPASIPASPIYMKGVVNIRGIIVPVIDLRERFQLPPKEYSKLTVVIIVQIKTEEGHERIMGLIVDAVSEVYDICDKNLRPPPEFSLDDHTSFLQGLGSVDNKMVIIIDVEKLSQTDKPMNMNQALKHIK